MYLYVYECIHIYTYMYVNTHILLYVFVYIYVCRYTFTRCMIVCADVCRFGCATDVQIDAMKRWRGVCVYEYLRMNVD